MTKTRLAFVDHPFHQKTRSSDFFVRILKDYFEVDIFYFEPDPRAVIKEIVDAGYTIAVCWQTEFCAPYFLMSGLRVICVPMFDGVEHAPDFYWLSMRQARFISFCHALHSKLLKLGIETNYFQYFKEPAEEAAIAKFDDLSAFFWQRRPEFGVHAKFVRRLIGDYVSTIHVHNAPDVENADNWHPAGPNFSVSSFTADGKVYRDALAKANIYICPRHTEGIGMAMLEALSRGMCVIANDAPTANEYIESGINGILVDYNSDESLSSASKGRFHLDRNNAAILGKAARQSYLEGFARWNEQKKMIPFLVSTAPVADIYTRELLLKEKYLKISRFANRDFARFLVELNRLQTKGLTGLEYSASSLLGLLMFRVRSMPLVRFFAKRANRLYRLAIRVRNFFFRG